MVDGLGPHFLLTKSDSVIPGVAVLQDFLKVFWKVNLESTMIPRNFT